MPKQEFGAINIADIWVYIKLTRIWNVFNDIYGRTTEGLTDYFAFPDLTLNGTKA